MLKYLKTPRNLMEFNLMRGVTDFGNTRQYDMYEHGYSGIFVISRPKFLEMLAARDPNVKILLENYCKILECEFKGLDGLENVQGETSSISNNIKELNIITKVTGNSATTVSMRYTEKSGSTLTKLQEYYLYGIKDEHTQAKTYHGLIDDGLLEPGYENEVFTILYYVTDNTYRNLEKAYLLLNCQPTTAENSSLYAFDRGDIAFNEITVSMNCFPVVGDEVNRRAKLFLDYYMSEKAGKDRIIVNSDNFNFTGINKLQVPN